MNLSYIRKGEELYPKIKPTRYHLSFFSLTPTSDISYPMITEEIRAFTGAKATLQ